MGPIVFYPGSELAHTGVKCFLRNGLLVLEGQPVDNLRYSIDISKTFARYLKKHLVLESSLQLDLSHNALCGVYSSGAGSHSLVGINALAEMLRQNSVLRQLNLSGNWLGIDGFAELTMVLPITRRPNIHATLSQH